MDTNKKEHYRKLKDLQLNKVVRVMNQLGWILEKGNHYKFRHPDKADVIVIPGSKGKAEVFGALLKKTLESHGVDWSSFQWLY
jgi:predicted RNA binding protein YcfA (HicA-like mRNA interferase family)